MDFGIARAMADTGATMTQTSAVIGTAQYLSPEQARGEQVDARSDLYSTGCLLYELLTGRPPFVGDSPVSVAYQHVREEPVPPSHLDPDVPRDADAIVLQGPDQGPRAALPDRRRDAPRHRRRAGRPSGRHLRRRHRRRPSRSTARRSSPARRPSLRSPTTSTTREGRGGRSFGYALLALAVLAVFVIAALLGRSLFGGSGAETVVGARRRRAHGRAGQDRAAGGEPDARVDHRGEQRHRPRGQHHRPEPRGRHPARGERRRCRSRSRPAQKETTVPSLVGLSLDEARQALREADLELGATTQGPSKRARGHRAAGRPRGGRDRAGRAARSTCAPPAAATGCPT